MKHKVSELSGGMLDAAVALAQGSRVKIEDGRAYILAPYDDGSQINSGRTEWLYFAPSCLWKEGGWIIQRELIGLQWLGDDRGWFAGHCRQPGPGVADGRGPTPLIAAMRAYVVSKLGEEVDLP